MQRGEALLIAGVDASAVPALTRTHAHIHPHPFIRPERHTRAHSTRVYNSLEQRADQRAMAHTGGLNERSLAIFPQEAIGCGPSVQQGLAVC
eukprot:COSAG01_NODE_4433_length_5029_cov_21.493103_4_plen_92_part_00